MPRNVKPPAAKGADASADGGGEAPPAKRAYKSQRRAQQARETRDAILAAALTLFTERGYGGASITAIAEAAGVAPETVYATFKNKRALLVALEDEAIVGDAEPVPLFDRPFVQAARRETDQRARVRALRPGFEATARSSALASIIRGAAAIDPEVAALWKGRQAARYNDTERFVALITELGPLRVDFREAVDITWALGSSDIASALIRERGWTVERYITMVSELLESLVVDDAQ